MPTQLPSTLEPQDSARAPLPAVCVVGLGYVGSVVAASLAARGVSVVGVDLKRDVVEAMERGIPPINEPGLAERIEDARRRGTLRATTDLESAVRASSMSLVCVGTPIGADGQLVESSVLASAESIARIATRAGTPHCIVIRSTVPPGHYARALQRIRNAVGEALGDTVTLALNPEFLREGAAVKDLEDPELVVYATEHPAAVIAVEALYERERARLVRTEPSTAEVLKLVNNVWHALKVSFANEVARVSGPLHVDAFAVMELLCRDRRLNTSAAYLRPGMPFGGACLTKDVAALGTHAAQRDVAAPLIAGILASNDAHHHHFVREVLAHRPKCVAVVGIGFKPGASDVRDSAPAKLVLSLLDVGVHVCVADSAVLAARVPPLGLDALRSALGDDRAEASPSVADAIAHADVIVAGHPCREDAERLGELRAPVPLLDLAGELTRALGVDRAHGRGVVNVLSGAKR